MIRAPLLSLILIFSANPAFAQTSIEIEGATETSQSTTLPRTTDGKPDFTGYWEHAFITSTGRMQGAKSLVVSDAGAKAISDAMVKWAHSEAAGVLIDPDFFTAHVTDLLKVGGEWRTSLITTPADGVQPDTPEGKRLDSEYKARKNGLADGPESRPLFERCLIGVGSAPLSALPARMIRQFVQTDDHLVVSTDANDVRVISLNALPRPAGIISPLGDTVAHWEDDVLVVHTTSLQGQIHTQIITRPQSRVIERFEMISANEMLDQFTVEDTAIYAEPFNAEFVMHRTDDPVLEYACHEGNYAMTNILQAGRVAERRKAS